MRRPPTTRTRRVSACALARLTSRDCAVIGLLLVERLSLVEAAIALDVPVPRLRREYESAIARLHRSLAPLVRRARQLAAPRVGAALRRAS